MSGERDSSEPERGDEWIAGILSTALKAVLERTKQRHPEIYTDAIAFFKATPDLPWAYGRPLSGHETEIAILDKYNVQFSLGDKPSQHVYYLGGWDSQEIRVKRTIFLEISMLLHKVDDLTNQLNRIATESHS
ncbi:hypothetical protein CMO96_03320 [Candidatus Woesebacteria bacterium]|nr:hypothetical protein [Candidatus Woesebacteria bacterium]